MPEREVYEEHPEIHHYTNWAGLEGIISSGTLWATRFDKLNDSTEVNHLRHQLIESVGASLVGVVQEIIDSKPRYVRRHMLRKEGVPDIAKHEARALIDSIYEVSFLGRPGSQAFAVPYIASFCSHCGDDGYLRENGLLSQWRGYGGTERYAVVFDTEALSAAMKEETKRFSYMFGNLGDAIYNDDELNFAERFSELIGLFVHMYETYHGPGPDSIAMEELYESFMITATRFKHRAFREEREVRIAAAPLTEELQAYIRDKGGEDVSRGRRIKAIRKRGKVGSEVPYVVLLEESETPLPIKRIVVGPCVDQKLAAQKAAELTRGKVRLVLSETPFIG